MEVDEKQENHEQNQPSSEPLPPAIEKVVVESQFKNQYEEFFKDCTLTENDIKEAATELKRAGIQYDPSYFEPETTIVIKKFTSNHRIVTLEVTIGFFKMDMLVLNEEIMSPVHHCQSTSTAKNVGIFFAKDTKEAVKCYEISKEAKPERVFAKALRECFFLRIAAALKIGPIYTKQSGFDLIFYSNCVEFSMELCTPVKKAGDKVTLESCQSLKKKLLMLHRLRVIHLDVKTDNVMYSHLGKSLIYIDYGFSKTIEKSLGFKSMTLFAGTFQYCGPQMRKMVVEEESIAVDLYYNDAFGLAISLQELNKISKDIKQVINDDSDDDELQYLLVDRIKKNYLEYYRLCKINCQIYFQNKTLYTESPLKTTLIRHRRKILSSLAEFPFSYFLIKLYEFLISFFRNAEEKKDYWMQFYSRQQTVFKRKTKRQYENMFANKLDLIIGQQMLTFSLSDQTITFLLTKDPKMYFLNLEKVRKMKKTKLLECYLETVDIRSNYSSFQQKKEYSLILFKLVDIKYQCIETHSEYPELQTALRWVLNFSCDQLVEGMQNLIPTALINLVIIHAFSGMQLKQLVRKILNLECSLLVKALTVFRCSQILGWINFTIQTRYSLELESSLHQSMMLSILTMKETQYHNLALIIMDSLAANQYIQLEGEDYLDFVVSVCDKFDKEKYSDVITEIVSLAVYHHALKESKENVQNIFQPLKRLHLIDNQIFVRRQIRYVHLLISLKFKDSPILNDINSMIIQCLQDPKLLFKTKLIYSQEASLEMKLDLQKRIDLFKTFTKDKILRFRRDTVDSLINILIEVSKKSKKEQSQILSQFREIITVEYLDNIPYPIEESSKTKANIVAVYELMFSIFRLICRLYPLEAPQVRHLETVTKRSEQFWSTINCRFCSSVTYYLICHLNLIVLQTLGESQQCVKLSLGAAQMLCNDQHVKVYTYDHISIFLQFIVLKLKNQPIFNSEQRKQISSFVFKILFSKKLYINLFNNDIGGQNETYQLMVDQILPNFQGYLNFHHHLLSFLQTYPSISFLIIYIMLLNYHQQSLRRNVPSILKEHFTSRINMGPHSALLFSHLFQLLQIDHPLFRKTAVLVCNSSDYSVGFTKSHSLMQFFSNIKALLVLLPTSRTRRQKVFSNARYFQYGSSFHHFLQFMDLKYIYKRRKRSRFELFLKKLKMFFKQIKEAIKS